MKGSFKPVKTRFLASGDYTLIKRAMDILYLFIIPLKSTHWSFEQKTTYKTENLVEMGR